jgi:hypothetical protein
MGPLFKVMYVPTPNTMIGCLEVLVIQFEHSIVAQLINVGQFG